MSRQLALATLSFAIVALVAIPYWIAANRLEAGRSRPVRLQAAVSAPLHASTQCPVPEHDLQARR